MTHRRKLRGALVAAVALACVAAPLAATSAAERDAQPGPAKVVVSKPSPGAISEAIAAVEPGGKVKLRKGRYREPLLIEKPVKLIAAGNGRPTIDGVCQFPSAVTVHSGGVVLKGLKIQGGAAFASVDFAGVPNGRAKDLRLRNTCGDTEYGINVFATGAVQITDNRATGFTDAGIYVGEVTSTPNGTLLVGDNVTTGNNKGIIVEFSTGGDIAVFENEINDNNIPGIGEQVGTLRLRQRRCADPVEQHPRQRGDRPRPDPGLRQQLDQRQRDHGQPDRRPQPGRRQLRLGQHVRDRRAALALLTAAARAPAFQAGMRSPTA